MIDGTISAQMGHFAFYDWTQRNVPFRKLSKHTASQVVSQSRNDSREYFLSSVFFVSLLLTQLKMFDLNGDGKLGLSEMARYTTVSPGLIHETPP